MRTAVASLIALVAANAGFAQSGSYLAEVKDDGVVCRTGPSAQLPDTGALPRGTRVIVDHVEGADWVAVQPPYGQVSWVRGVNLGPVGEAPASAPLPRNAVVNAEPDTVLAFGRPGLNKPLDARLTKVPDGTIVCVVGEKVLVDGVNWYPIVPPNGDFRYLPKSSVQKLGARPEQTFVVRSPTVTPTATLSAPEGRFEPTASVPGGPPAALNRPADSPAHPLWRQAEQATNDGDYLKAEALYLKLAAESNQTGGDPELAPKCYRRIHAVREKQRQANRPPATTTDQGSRPTGPPAAGQWVGPGTLRIAGFQWANRQTFALVDRRGTVQAYAVAGPGVDLNRFQGADVDLFGTVETPGELRSNKVVTVTRVSAARDR